jgi:hypothetical protein
MSQSPENPFDDAAVEQLAPDELERLAVKYPHLSAAFRQNAAERRDLRKQLAGQAGL